MMIRHLESAPLHEPSASVHVLFMAQALERAGDHVKNLAEEICHLTSGQTLRHVVRGAGNRAAAQMRLEALQPPRSELASPVEREGNVPH
jgi:phosphate uptake regulator